jgi:predicted transposase/invertase (TIGR01784 family)
MTGKCVGHADIEHANAIYQDAILKLNQLAEIEYESEYARAMALKYYRDFVNVMDTAKKESREEGIEKGKQKKSLKIAKIILAERFDIKTIVKITGLTEGDVIQEKINY